MAGAPVISAKELSARVGTADCPLILDVRKPTAFAAAKDLLPTARWRDPTQLAEWERDLPRGVAVVVYCVGGREVSQTAAMSLREAGLDASYLDDGITAWRDAGAPLVARSARTDAMDRRPSLWVTRERPKIDRIACPWLVRRFVDRAASFAYVPSAKVEAVARERGGEPYDIPGVAFSHVGEDCSFDAFIKAFGLRDAALDHLALIVRATDTGRLDLAPQASGLLAVSLGLSAMHPDDLTMLDAGMQLYDALYAWCRTASAETHGWPPAPAR
ncbi:MAG: sulfurtransferase [Alphaproteobacteria bacterium]|nr:sulfurtransferase [Alphaproteobacteria bacterium]